MIALTDTIAVSDDELSFSFIRASGPGGQYVNKVATAVQLRFDAAGSAALDEGVRARLLRIAGARATSEGVIVITAQRFRTQLRNRADALERLGALIEKALPAPVRRRPTRPTAASRTRRLEAKSRRAGVKGLRGRPEVDR